MLTFQSLLISLLFGLVLVNAFPLTITPGPLGNAEKQILANVCERLGSVLPGYHASSIPVIPAPGTAQERQLTPLTKISRDLLDFLFARLNCRDPNYNSATQTRQLSSGLLGALGVAPGVQLVERSSAAPEARQTPRTLDELEGLVNAPVGDAVNNRIETTSANLATIPLPDEDIDELGHFLIIPSTVVPPAATGAPEPMSDSPAQV